MRSCQSRFLFAAITFGVRYAFCYNFGQCSTSILYICVCMLFYSLFRFEQTVSIDKSLCAQTKSTERLNLAQIEVKTNITNNLRCGPSTTITSISMRLKTLAHAHCPLSLLLNLKKKFQFSGQCLEKNKQNIFEIIEFFIQKRNQCSKLHNTATTK